MPSKAALIIISILTMTQGLFAICRLSRESTAHVLTHRSAVFVHIGFISSAFRRSGKLLSV